MSNQKIPVPLWMIILFGIGVVCLIFGFDPIGDSTEKLLGKGADRVIVVINIIGIIAFLLFFYRKKS
jgi:hypothetical protein